MEFPKDRVFHSLICVFAFIIYYFSPFIILFIPNVKDFLQSNYSITLVTFLIYLPFSLIIWFAYQKNIKLMPLGSVHWRKLIAPLLALIALIFINGFLGTEEKEWIELTNNITGFAFFLFVLSIIFIAPITEEIIFRGFLLNAGMWYGNTGKWIAIITSSLLFSTIHTQYHSLSTFTLIFIMGIIFCQVRISTHSLIAPIVLHSLYNTLVITFSII
ncbi:putative inner membrane protein [Proteus hauseri ATCC 700826]|uniref:Inner membrane protein n=1 Tax=Proteus hauseri ATCC 700826 TaxID=1354271 RepID=A0AAJ3LSD3_PROHU|nr:type II CAAX endopeptidase family protein [Proteus hauseri]OAT44896.1 putative inner membrane protein [Proteus hauseri ATCC 700826]